MSPIAQRFCQNIVRPTLAYLGTPCRDAEAYLVGAAAAASGLQMFSEQAEGLGMFGITGEDHRRVWDQWLAISPDTASRVRGLASQHAFLHHPDHELEANPAYATAIFYHLTLMQSQGFPGSADVLAQAQLWSRVKGLGISGVKHFQLAARDHLASADSLAPRRPAAAAE